MGIITDIEHYQSHARRKSYKGPINEPCSACGDGDTAMKYHDHDPPSPSYTLAELEALAKHFDTALRLGTVEQLALSTFLAWLASREKERESNETHD